MKNFRPTLVTTACIFLIGAASAIADESPCAQPVTTGARPNVSDCLYILKVAVGATTCEPACVCQPAGTGQTTTRDALVCLRKAMAFPVLLDCQCPSSSLEVIDYSESTRIEFGRQPAFGFCIPLNTFLSATVTKIADDVYRTQGAIVEEGDRASGDACRDDIDALADHLIDCPIVRQVPSRVLTLDDIDRLLSATRRVQIDTMGDPLCSESEHFDPCSITWVQFNTGFYQYLDNEPCSTPRLLADQVFRFDLLMRELLHAD